MRAVFDVVGVIKITDRINVADNITIAGQTAPGDGVAIYGYGIITNGNNIFENSLLPKLRARVSQIISS